MQLLSNFPIREVICLSPELEKQPWGLLSIYPVYADKIYAQTKRFEYRKNKPIQNISVVVLYETAPVSKITGFFMFEEILQGTPDSLWGQTKNYSGIDRESYQQYFSQSSVAYAYAIKKASRITPQIPLKDIGISVPQALRYI